VCGRGAVEPHERGVADRFRDVVVYFSHGGNELVFRGKLPRENSKRFYSYILFRKYKRIVFSKVKFKRGAASYTA
jgi:hypothetical protein